MRDQSVLKMGRVAMALIGGAFAVVALPVQAAWEPTKPVEFVVPAGTGGGADQMARLLQGVITKNNLMKQPLIVVNKSGGAGAEGFLARQGRQGRPAQDHHHAVQPVHDAAGNWRAVQLEGHDAGRDAGARPVRPVGQRRNALQERARNTSPPSRPGAPPRSRWAAPAPSRKTRSSRSRSRRRPARSSPTCPSKAAATSPCSSCGKHVDSTVNNPIEAVAQWRAGSLRPLCVFDDARMPYKEKVTKTMSWNDIPTCKEAGLPIDYLMLRGIFMPAGVTQEQVDFYVDSVQEGARDAGLEEVHGRRRLQPDLHDRSRVHEMGRRRRTRPTSTSCAKQDSWPSSSQSDEGCAGNRASLVFVLIAHV